MKMKKDIEFETALSNIKFDLRSTRTMLAVFCVVAVIVKFVFRVPIPWLVIALVFIWFSLYFVYERLMKKARTAKKLYNIYFRNNVSDTLFLTLIIHYLGGVEWLGPVLYILVLVTAGVILPKKRAIILGFMAVFFYSVLAGLEYFGIISHRPIFLLEPGLYQSPGYVATHILFMAVVFYFVAETAGTFSEILRQKTAQLQEAYQETEEAREILEVKVKARTYELEKMTQSLEEKVKQRTKELETKIKELEKFQKIVVGRELKMIELKKALRKAKGKL